MAFEDVFLIGDQRIFGTVFSLCIWTLCINLFRVTSCGPQSILKYSLTSKVTLCSEKPLRRERQGGGRQPGRKLLPRETINLVMHQLPKIIYNRPHNRYGINTKRNKISIPGKHFRILKYSSVFFWVEIWVQWLLGKQCTNASEFVLPSNLHFNGCVTWQTPEARQKRWALHRILRINTKKRQTKNNVCSVLEYKEGWMESASSGVHCTHFQLRLKITVLEWK